MKQLFTLQSKNGEFGIGDAIIMNFIRIAAAKGYEFFYGEAKACIKYQHGIQKAKHTLPQRYFNFAENAKERPAFSLYPVKPRLYANKIVLAQLSRSGYDEKINDQVVADFIKLAAS